MKTRAGQQLYCLDWDQADVALFGNESTQNYAFFEIAAVPCNLKLTLPFYGGTDDKIDEDCVWDLKA